MTLKLLQLWRDTGWGADRLFWFETTVLGSALPLLLFPTRFPVATLIILLLLLLNWLLQLLPAGRRTVEHSPMWLALLLFAAWSIIPLLVTADPDLTLQKGAGLLLGLATWRWVSRYVTHDAGRILLFSGYLLLGTGFVGIGFLAVDWLEKIPAISAIVNLLPQQLISLTATGSGQGVQPNQLAGTLLWLVPLPLTAAWTLWQRKWRPLAIGLTLLGLLLLGILILSQSRGGWLGGLAAIGIGLWLAAFGLEAGQRYRVMRWGWPAVALLALVTLLAVLGPNRLFNLWLDPPDASLVGNLGTLSFRQEVWTWAILAIGDFPFTGTGLGTFRVVVHRLYPIAIPVTYDIAHAHNVFLQIALDFGLPGLSAYLSLIGLYFFLGFQLIVQRSEWRIMAIGLMMALAGFHVYGLVDTIAIGAKPGLLFWLLLGMMNALFVAKREPSLPISHPPTL